MMKGEPAHRACDASFGFSHSRVRVLCGNDTVSIWHGCPWKLAQSEGGRRINTTLIRDPPEVPQRTCVLHNPASRTFVCAICYCNTHPKAVKCRRKNISQYFSGRTRGFASQKKKAFAIHRALTQCNTHKSHSKHCASSALETEHGLFLKLLQYIALLGCVNLALAVRGTCPQPIQEKAGRKLLFGG
jgi:hypothetical protein